MDKKYLLNLGFYLILISLIRFGMGFTSNLLFQFCIALIGALIGNLIYKTFVKPKI